MKAVADDHHPGQTAAITLSRVIAGALDDAAYSIGVWQGMLRHLTEGPALPRLIGISAVAEPVVRLARASAVRRPPGTWLGGLRRASSVGVIPLIDSPNLDRLSRLERTFSMPD